MSDEPERVVVITGAAGALGRVAATMFFEQGDQLALLDRNDDVLDRTWHAAEQVFCLHTELTLASSVHSSVGSIMERFGRIDALINIAGGFSMGQPVHESSEELWDKMLQVNAKSVFLMCREVLPVMRRQKKGHIVNVSAKSALQGASFMAPYVISKSAVIRLTECLAEENSGEGVHVNCVLPSIIDTPANRKDMPDADFSGWVAPEAIVDVIKFLVSPASRAVNGASIPVYGLS
ncbi:MAG: SDR family NAD(P)-dependent oxidoreductase [Chlorobium sp.]|nr:SDR family NAD(P)-dependent oxidoreductase [Chlorobium sp.]MCW8819776.1 SDR family NAD(P)-dependent oxidoreductase [Ignavibacteriaceae bacterium]